MRKYLTIAITLAAIIILTGIVFYKTRPDYRQRLLKELKWHTYGREERAQNEDQRYWLSRVNELIRHVESSTELDKYLPIYAGVGLNQTESRINYLGFGIDWFEDGFTSSGIRITYTDENNQEKSLDIPFPGGSWGYGHQKDYKDVYLRKSGFRSVENLETNPFRPDDIVVELPLSIIDRPIYLSIYDDEGNESEKIQCRVVENDKGKEP